MKKYTLLGTIFLILAMTGCRSVFEPGNPFTHGRWKYSQVYAPLDYDVAWETIKDNLKEWKIGKANKDKGEIDTEWRVVRQFRTRAQVRLDRKKDEQGNEGVKFGIRVIRQRPSEIWTPMRTNYKKWKWVDPDEKMESTLLLRFDYALQRLLQVDYAQPPEDN